MTLADNNEVRLTYRQQTKEIAGKNRLQYVAKKSNFKASGWLLNQRNKITHKIQ